MVGLPLAAQLCLVELLSSSPQASMQTFSTPCHARYRSRTAAGPVTNAFFKLNVGFATQVSRFRWWMGALQRHRAQPKPEWSLRILR